MRTPILFSMMLSALVMCSCINNDENLYEGPDSVDAKEIVAKYVMTEKFEVPIQEGYSTVVMNGEDTLYYGNIPMQIDVPKFDVSGTTKAADELKWHYTPTIDTSKWSCSASRKGILMFEDLDIGDSDYNDFVCAIVEEISYAKANWPYTNGEFTASLKNIRVKPLALGNTIPLKFGIEFRKKSDSSLLKDLVIATNVRTDLFAGKTGFINTTNDLIVTDGNLKEVPYTTGEQLGTFVPSELCVLWYIESKGVKRYVADAGSKFLNQDVLGGMVTQNKVPFGLFVPIEFPFMKWTTTFRWPLETNSIFNAYPNFNKWLKGEVNTPFGNPNNSLLFDTSKLKL